MLGMLKHLWADETGLTTVEYALLLILIVAAGVTTWTTFGTQIGTNVGEVTTTLFPD